MARLDEIIATALVFAGQLTDAERSILERLCAAAEESMAARLREGVSEEEYRESFVCACAFLALSSLGVAQEADGVESFTAGTLTIRKRSGAANCLAIQAEVMLAPYLRDASFAFQEV